MRLPTSSCFVLVGVTALASTQAQGSTSRAATGAPAAAKGQDKVQGGSVLGIRQAVERAQRLEGKVVKPFLVNGVKLDQLEVDRQTVYMVGQRTLQQKLIELIVEDQMAEQIKAGAPKKMFDVIEDDVQKHIEKTIKDWKTKNPGGNFYAQLAKTNTTPEEYVTIQRSTILFDKVFFRGIPSKWPQITREAIVASGGAQGTAFFNKFAEAVKEGQDVPPLWLHICRTWVIKKMQEWADVRYASDGVPPDVILSVNGRVWKTEHAMRTLALKIKPEDRVRALVDIVLQTSLRQELKKAGMWLSDEQFRKEFEDYRKPYDDTPFTVKVLAMSFKGYPSFEVYKARWRLERSFEHMIAKEINDDTLGAHLVKARAFLSDGRTSLEAIRMPAFDDAAGTWRKDGFAAARGEAEQVMRKIESGAMTFEDAMSKHAIWPEHFKDQGKLSGKSLNEIRQELKENEYTDFIQGYSVAEILFYDVAIGAVAGPLRGQDGYYICKITQRLAPTGTVTLGEKNQRDLVRQDFLSHRFLSWANEVAGRTRVE